MSSALHRPFRILIVEDKPADVELLLAQLHQAGVGVRQKIVASKAAYLESLTPDLDAIICDYSMPQLSGREALELLQAKGLDIPLLFISSASGEEKAVELMQLGAADYVMKDRLARMPQALGRAIAAAAARQELRDQQTQYRILFDGNPSPMWVFDLESLRFLEVNDMARRHYGFTRQEFLAMSILDIRPAEDIARVRDDLAHRIDTWSDGKTWRHLHKDGSLHLVETYSTTISFKGRPARMVMSLDVTERERKARELRLSEARLRAVIDAEPECVKTVSAEGHILEINPAGLRLFEVESNREIQGRHIGDFIHPEDRPAYLELHHKSAAGGSGHLQFRVIGMKGTERWMETHSVSLKDGEAAPGSVLSVTRDITDQRRAEAAMRLQASMLDQIGQAVIATDLSGKVIYANRFAGELFGWLSLAEMGGTDILEVTVPQTSRADAQQIMAGLERGEKWSGEFICRRRNGTEFEALVTSAPLLDNNGKLLGITAIYSDITDRKRVEATLRQSEADLENAQRIAHVGSWKWDVTSEEMESSAEVYRIFGIRPGERALNCARLMRAVHPEDLHLVEQAFADALAGRGRYSIDHRVVHPNGTQRVVHGEAEVIFDESGKPLKVVGTVQDVTARKAIEAELRESAERIGEQAALLDLAHDAIMVRSMEDRILYWNHGAQKLYGWNAQEVLGKEASGFLHNDDPFAVNSSRTALLETGEWTGECKHLRKNGGTVTVRSRWSLVRDERGEPKSILIINTDITEQKKIEAQFLRAQRLESIGTLASGVAHDLNNVLSPILMSAPLLHTDLDAELREKIITTIEQSAERGAQIVKQVLTFARGVEGERVLIDPSHLLKEMVQIAEQTFPKSIRVTSRYPEDLWLVEADPTQFHQILLNLSVNARDAMPNGGTLQLAAENFEVDEHYASMMPGAEPGVYVLITATDNGLGIPSEIVDKIFDPFFTTKDLGVGSGLGLSTVLGIVKSHGGFLAVESEPGTGSTFKVFLPAISGTATLAAETETAPEGKGETILVVDDEPAILAAAKLILERQNYRVLGANDGPEALAVFAQEMSKIDVVMTDLMMPFMDGVAVVRSMKKMKPDVRIIASTGLDERTRLSELQGLGVNASLPKPYNRAKLLETLRAVVENGAVNGAGLS